MLVVEPDSAQRRLVEIMLKQLGYCPSVCATACKAKRLVQEGDLSPLCLFTSMRLGTTNGYQLAVELQSSQPNLNAIFTSNSSLEDTGREYDVELKVNSFLRKPYTIEQLGNRLQLFD